jgi:hypothetical protein
MSPREGLASMQQPRLEPDLSAQTQFAAFWRAARVEAGLLLTPYDLGAIVGNTTDIKSGAIR